MSKLHPVYVALDNHQYSRAIKLASALPDSNILGKALLAHAYYKSGQQYQAMVTLNKILNGRAGSRGFFCELELELGRALEGIEEREQQGSKAANPESTPVLASKKGKKGKRKPTSKPTSPAMASSVTKEMDASGPDLMDVLLTKPTLPENWDSLPASSDAITDETTIATMSVTLNGLKLPLTAYQIYSWATTNPQGATEANLQKTYCLGLTVLAAPSIWTATCQQKIAAHVLSRIQSVALQWAKMYAKLPGGLSTYRPMLATAWAAQSALWQLQWLPKDEKRSMILPRLAESMSQKLLQQDNDSAQAAQIQCLALRTLEQQSKWEEMLEILQEPAEEGDSPSVFMSDFGVALTRHQKLKDRARVLKELGRYDGAKNVYEKLLVGNPDNWSCWKEHLDCCSKTDDVNLTQELVERVLSEQAGAKYPLRGPHLMKVELQAHRVQSSPDGASLAALASSIKEYGQLFASRAICAFSDLEMYLQLAISTDVDQTKEVVGDLLQWARDLQMANIVSAEDGKYGNKERQARLRVYIFSVKFNHRILAKHVEMQDLWLPDVVELVKEWKSTLSMSSSNEGEESQKEVKPGDDLILLIVQQMLCKNSEDLGCQIVGLALLEMAIDHSPDNAYLKIMAIYLYYLLDAVPRSYDLFVTMGIKHIQLDSCTFTILPFLMEGGLYNEAIEICNAMLKFQTSTARDCGDYAGRAMEDGTITKADEFLVFQRKKMNASLSVLNAKGIILDSASVRATPVQVKKVDEDGMLKGDLGADQGIIGGDDDMPRAANMIVQAHKPYAALSLVSWADHGGSVADCDDLADNRDLSILSNQILWQLPCQSREEIGREALRRGHIHGMLLRATLCLDAAKGPKKGKIVKPTEQLLKRTQSLLDSVDRVSSFAERHAISGTDPKGTKALLMVAVELCRAIAVINAGLPSTAEDDTLEAREQQAHDLLHASALSRLKEANDSLAFSVKNTAFLLPNLIVPLFAIFRMCTDTSELYGWGKRKYRSKPCAGALKQIAAIFSDLVSNMKSSLSSLHNTEGGCFDNDTFSIDDNYRSLVEASVLEKELRRLTQAQFRTRLRIEPILQQINDFLSSFDVNDD